MTLVESQICPLCGYLIPVDERWPAKLSATIDHKIPRALGGTDCPTNLQITHRECNSIKSCFYPVPEFIMSLCRKSIEALIAEGEPA